MWKNILTWLLKFALERLGTDVDAETQKQIDQYNQARESLDKCRETAEIELGRIEHQRLELLAKRVSNSHEIEFLQEQIKSQDETLRRLTDEKNEKLSVIRNSDDDTILHGDL